MLCHVVSAAPAIWAVFRCRIVRERLKCGHTRAVRLTAGTDEGAAVGERAVLEAALKGPEAPKPDRIDIAPGLRLETKAGRAVLSGQAVDAAFLDALRDWARARAEG